MGKNRPCKKWADTCLADQHKLCAALVKLGVDSGAPSSDGERQLVLADRGSLAKVGRPSSHFGIAHSAPISNKSTP